MELDILLLLSTKENYNKYIKYIKSYTITKEGNNIIKDLDYYYTNTSETEVDWSEFSTWFRAIRHSGWNEETTKVYQKIFERLGEKATSGGLSGVESDVINHYVTLDYATQIFDESAKVAEGATPTLDKVVSLVDDYNKVINKSVDLEVMGDDDIEDVLTKLASKEGLKWRLKSLNDSIGDISVGDLIAIGARPDGGKTTLLASEATFMSNQIPPDKYILWFNNEERKEKVKLRIMEAALGKNNKDIYADPVVSKRDYQKAVGGTDRIILYDAGVITDKDILSVIEKYPPSLIIIDQLSKVQISGKRDLNEAQKAHSTATFARNIAKEHCPVLFTIWADGSAEGEPWIQMNQLYGSKTGIQGEADAIIALGRKNDEPTISDRDNRYIHICKNKICGGDPSLSNGKFEVKIQPQIARFKE